MARPGRPAINTSSTRCLTPWQAEADPSRIHVGLLAGVGLTATTALLAYTPFDIWARLLAGLCVLVLVLRQLLLVSRRGLQMMHDPAGLWTIQTAVSPLVSGQLVNLGYRSAHLLIITIQSDDGALHRFPVWCDQLPGRHFSYLQQQLAFACEEPERCSFRWPLSQQRRRLD